jgi:glutaredoxin
MTEFAERQVILYVTPLCSPCERLRAYLRSRDVAFRVKDLMMDEDAAEHLESRNVRGSPALEVDGEIVAGPALDKARIDAMLGL